MAKTRKEFEKDLTSATNQIDDIVELPAKGWNREKIIQETKNYLGAGEFDWTKGTQSGTVYNGIIL